MPNSVHCYPEGVQAGGARRKLPGCIAHDICQQSFTTCLPQHICQDFVRGGFVQSEAEKSLSAAQLIGEAMAARARKRDHQPSLQSDGVLDPLENNGLGTDGLAHQTRQDDTLSQTPPFSKQLLPPPWASNATHCKKANVCNTTQFVRSSIVQSEIDGKETWPPTPLW